MNVKNPTSRDIADLAGVWTDLTIDTSTLTSVDPSQIQSIGLQVHAGDTAVNWIDPTIILVDSITVQ